LAEKGWWLMLFPALFRSYFNSTTPSHGKNLTERRRSRLYCEVLEPRDAPANVGPNPLPSLALPVTPTSAGAQVPSVHANFLPTIEYQFGAVAAQSRPAASAGMLAFAVPSSSPHEVTSVPVAPANLRPPPGPIPVNVFGPSMPSPADGSLQLFDVPEQIRASTSGTITFTAQARNGVQPAESPQYSIAPVPGAVFPDGAVIDPDTGEFHWTPTTGFYAVEVGVRDGNNTATKIVHIWVRE
jgi:hypothetical protein